MSRIDLDAGWTEPDTPWRDKAITHATLAAVPVDALVQEVRRLLMTSDHPIRDPRVALEDSSGAVEGVAQWRATQDAVWALARARFRERVQLAEIATPRLGRPPLTNHELRHDAEQLLQVSGEHNYVEAWAKLRGLDPVLDRHRLRYRIDRMRDDRQPYLAPTKKGLRVVEPGTALLQLWGDQPPTWYADDGPRTLEAAQRRQLTDRTAR